MKKIKINSYIDDLVTAGSADLPLIGNEAFNFSRLYNQEVKVPEAAVLTTLAFDDFLVTTNATEQILELLSQVQPFIRQTAKDASEQIVNLVMTSELPKGIRTDLQRIYQTLAGNGNKSYIQLESSHVIEEKFLPEETKNLSYYDINDFDDFISKVRLIWSSLFSTEAIEIRTNRYYRGPITIAILVRQMRKFEISGKIYSIPPITKDPNTLEITANFGIMDPSVDREQFQDSYKVDITNLKIIEKKIIPQEFMVLRNGTQNTNSSKRTTVEISKEWRRRQKIEDPIINNLSQMLIDLEANYQSPIEIEWGIETGEIYITDVEVVVKEDDPIAIQDEKEFLKSFAANPSEINKDDLDDTLKEIREEIETIEENDIKFLSETSEERINKLRDLKSEINRDTNWPKWSEKYKLTASTFLDISGVNATNLHVMSLFNGTYLDSTDAILSRKILPEMIFKDKSKFKIWLDSVLQAISIAATSGDEKEFIYQFSNPGLTDLTTLSIPDKFKQFYGDERFIQFPEALASEVLMLQMLNDHYSTPPIHICFPYVRNLENLKNLKKIVNAQGFIRSKANKFFAELAVPSMAYEIDEVESDLIDGIVINYDVLLRISVYRSTPRDVDHKTLSRFIKQIVLDAKKSKLETYIKFSEPNKNVLGLIADCHPTGYIFSYVPSEAQIKLLVEQDKAGLKN